MSYEITHSETGDVFIFDDDVPREEARLRIIQLKPNLFPDYEAPSGMFAGVKSGYEKLMGEIRAAPSVTFGAYAGDQERIDEGISAYRESSAKAASALPYGVTTDEILEAYEDEGIFSAAGKAGLFSREMIGQSIPVTGSGIVAAAAARSRFMPSAVSKGIATTLGRVLPGLRLAAGAIPIPHAKVALGVAAAVGTYALEHFSSNLRAQHEAGAATPEEFSPFRAAAAAVPQAGLEFVTPFLLGAAGRPAQIAAASSLSRLLRGGTKELAERRFGPSVISAIEATAEIPTELSQDILQRAQAGESISPDDAEFVRSMVETFWGTIPVAGAFGLVGGSSAQWSANKRRERKERLSEDERKARESSERSRVNALAEEEVEANRVQADRVSRWESSKKEASDLQDIELWNAIQSAEDSVVLTPDDVVELAEGKNINTEDEAFHVFSERNTSVNGGQGKSKLDDMNQAQLRQLYALLQGFSKQKDQTSLPMYTREEFNAVLENTKSGEKVTEGKVRRILRQNVSERRETGKKVARSILAEMKRKGLTEEKTSKKDGTPTKQTFRKSLPFTEDEYQSVLDSVLKEGELTQGMVESTLGTEKSYEPDFFDALRDAMIARNDIREIGGRTFGTAGVSKLELLGYRAERGYFIRDKDGNIIGGAYGDKQLADLKARDLEKAKRGWVLYEDGVVARNKHGAEVRSVPGSRTGKATVTRQMKALKRANPNKNYKLEEDAPKYSASATAEEGFVITERTSDTTEYVYDFVSTPEQADEVIRANATEFLGADPLGRRAEKVMDEARQRIAERGPIQFEKPVTPGAEGVDPGLGRSNVPLTEEETAKRSILLQGIRDIMNSFGLADVGIRLEEAITDESGTIANAAHSRSMQRIRIALDRINPNLPASEQMDVVADILNHEVVHSFRSLDLFTEEEWNSLVDASGRIPIPDYIAERDNVEKGTSFSEWAEGMYGARVNSSGQSVPPISGYESPGKRIEEGVAEMFRAYVADPSLIPKESSTILRKIQRFFEATLNYMVGVNPQDPVKIFDDMIRGEIGGRERNQIRTIQAPTPGGSPTRGRPTVGDTEGSTEGGTEGSPVVEEERPPDFHDSLSIASREGIPARPAEGVVPTGTEGYLASRAYRGEKEAWKFEQSKLDRLAAAHPEDRESDEEIAVMREAASDARGHGLEAADIVMDGINDGVPVWEHHDSYLDNYHTTMADKFGSDLAYDFYGHGNFNGLFTNAFNVALATGESRGHPEVNKYFDRLTDPDVSMGVSEFYKAETPTPSATVVPEEDTISQLDVAEGIPGSDPEVSEEINEEDPIVYTNDNIDSFSPLPRINQNNNPLATTTPLQRPALHELAEKGVDLTERSRKIANGEIVGKSFSKNDDTMFSVAARRDSHSPEDQAAIDSLSKISDDESFYDRVRKATTGKPPGHWKQKILNKYEALRQIAEKLNRGERDLLADVSALAAALQSDRYMLIVARVLDFGIPIYRDGRTLVEALPIKVWSERDGRIVEGSGGLVEILKPLFDWNGKEILQEWHARRKGTRDRRFSKEGRLVGSSEEQRKIADEVAKKYVLPDGTLLFDIVDENFNKWNDGVVDFMAATGVVDAKMASIYKEFGDYIPFYRQHTDESDAEFDDKIATLISEEYENIEGEERNNLRRRSFNPATSTLKIKAPRAMFSSMTGAKPPKRSKGGVGNVVDPIEGIIMNTTAAISSGMKNIAGQRTMRDAVDALMADEVYTLDTAKNWLARIEANDSLEPDRKEELLAEARAEIEKIEKNGSTYDSRAHHTIRVNGQDRHYSVADELLHECLLGLVDGTLPYVSLFSRPAQFLRNMVVRSPTFVVGNLLKDSMEAWVTSGADFVPYLDTMKNFTSLTISDRAAGTTQESYRELLNAGVIGGHDLANEAQDARREFVKKLRKEGMTPGVKGSASATLKRLWEWSGDVSTKSDAATRISVYQDVMKNLTERGYSFGVAQTEAIYQAQEVLNFSRRGSSAGLRYLTAAIPFLNSKIQGMYKFSRAITGNYASDMAKTADRRALISFLGRASLISAATFVLFLRNKDDEDWLNQTPEDQDLYFYLGKFGGMPGIKVPIPFEVGTLFKTIPERFLRYIWGSAFEFDSEDWSRDKFQRGVGVVNRGDGPAPARWGAGDERALTEALVRVVNQTLFSSRPTTITGVAEVYANYNSYTGRSIVPYYEEDLPAEMQASPKTPDIIVEVGKALNVSPRKIDHLVKSYTGPVGGLFLSYLLDPAFRIVADSPARPNRRIVEYPVLKRILYDDLGQGGMNLFYDYRSAVDQNTKAIQRLVSQGKGEEAARFAKDKKSSLATVKARNKIDKILKKLSRVEKQILLAPEDVMTSDEKTKKIHDIIRARQKITMRARDVRSAADLSVELPWYASFLEDIL